MDHREHDDEADQRDVVPARPSYASLPAEVLVLIFALVPADQLPRLALVCSSFRAALRTPELWARLDLRAASGVARVVTDATFGVFAARFAERAGERLAALDLSGCYNVTRDALVAAVAANPGVELSLLHERALSCAAVTELRRAAGPNLGLWRVNLDCPGTAEACDVLRTCAVARLRVTFVTRGPDADSLTALLAAVAAGGVSQLLLLNANLSSHGAFDALVDGVILHRLPYLALRGCTLPDDGAAALERLLRDGASLRELDLQGSTPLFNAEYSECPLARGLAANTSLRVLSLRNCALWDTGEDRTRRRTDATLALLAALASHPSLCKLNLGSNMVWLIPVRNAATEAVDAVVGAAFAALLRTPALLELDMSGCQLRPGVLAPLFAALHGATTLRVLHCGDTAGLQVLSEEFVRETLAPAVATNQGLRYLFVGDSAHNVELEVAHREARRLGAGDAEETNRLLDEATRAVAARRGQYDF